MSSEYGNNSDIFKIPSKPSQVTNVYQRVWILNGWHSIPISIAASEDFEIIVDWLYEQNQKKTC